MKKIPEHQRHVLERLDALSGKERAELERQLELVDFPLIERLAGKLMSPAGDMMSPAGDMMSPASEKQYRLEPAPVIRLPRSEEELAHREEAREAGLRALADGRVAAFTASGGQGTRLGIAGPKGAVSPGLPSGRTLFQMQADMVKALSERAGVAVPWYLMTSEANDLETHDFFRRHGYLGLDEKDVFFMQQQMMPAVDTDGRLILSEKNRIFMSPNGHGGTFEALARSGALDDMDRRGVDIIFYCQVDNPLVRLCDPVFIGYHLRASAGMSLKVTAKCNAEEKVGVLGLRDGKAAVIEYSDLGEEEMHATGPDGGLLYWAGSIAIHVLGVDFARRVGSGALELPYHMARKPIPSYDTVSGETVKVDGVKFETFIFDALPMAGSMAAMEVERRDEFAPVKNRTGVDSVETARDAISDHFARMLEEAGVPVPRGEDGRPVFPIEVSPLYAMDAVGLKARLPADFVVTGPLYLE